MTHYSCSTCGEALTIAEPVVGSTVSCPVCNTELELPVMPPVIPELEQRVKEFQAKARAGELVGKDLASFDPFVVERLLYQVILTTESAITSHDIVQRVAIVTYEAAFGMSIFADFFTMASDLFGGRSKTTQKTLRNARNAVLKGLREEALLCGADAVIAVDLDYSEFSGGGKSMLFLVGSGTAVRWVPRER